MVYPKRIVDTSTESTLVAIFEKNDHILSKVKCNDFSKLSTIFLGFWQKLSRKDGLIRGHNLH